MTKITELSCRRLCPVMLIWKYFPIFVANLKGHKWLSYFNVASFSYVYFPKYNLILSFDAVVTEGRPGWIHKPLCVHVVCVRTHTQTSMAGVCTYIGACLCKHGCICWWRGMFTSLLCVHGCVYISVHVCMDVYITVYVHMGM